MDDHLQDISTETIEGITDFARVWPGAAITILFLIMLALHWRWIIRPAMYWERHRKRDETAGDE